ncbi:hypothetical protein OO007_09595 [Cocleimonas sp. KMM 6892]|uniref:hypothetical protein n=1 Tax=unclassified Cocleimonas TaxID=2639732 RepID=UPI002DB738F9|nr:MULTISPECIES: hypothetical protein [unclassified Cocleimonas]MEB8432476.1 hypothetical protein [Cocleimonas sp. KMM 6892]MEC4715335.1 hypothetical protein [Cocleimonas sp. KMM 6895]MEC4745046.1 hypothetical protein [Cocleimonas sp. KMM 6896]
MTESRYKIEYIQPEPVKKKNFRFLGVLGYLWVALLASVFTYGFVYKHISTSDVIAYFQNFKSEVVNTNIVSLTEQTSPNEIDITASKNAPTSELESANNATNNSTTVSNDLNTEDTNSSQKLVSEIIEEIQDTADNTDNGLPEDVVFESETDEPISSQTQLQSTESIINELSKVQNNQETLSETANNPESSDSVNNAIAAIENEIKNTETATQEVISTPQVITKEVVALKIDNKTTREESSEIQQSTKENETENSTIAKSQEVQIDAITAAIKEQEKEQEVKKAETEVTIADVIIEKKSVKDSLSALVKSTTTPNKTDQAYLNAANNYEQNKIASKDFLQSVKAQDSKPAEEEEEEEETNSNKEPERANTSAVDAIIAAMNADKAAKEKPVLSSQEKTQSDVNELLKNNEKIQSASQLNLQAN